jgi:putative hydroxymethylpyrimidine transport system substrate-binding protein
MKKVAALVVAALAVAVSAGWASAAGSADRLTNVKFVFNFAPGGYDANLLAAESQGFFKQQGLKVSFIVPATGADPAKLIANGTANIGLVHSLDVLLARSKGLPLVSVGTTHQFGTLTVLCPAAKNVHKLTDLYGKTYGLTGIPADRVMFEQMLKLNHVDESKIKVVVAGFAGVPQLLAGRIDCYEAISWYEPILYNLQLKKAANDTSTYTSILYYKNKIPRFYTFGLTTSESFLQKNPDVVKKFLAAWVKGTQWAISHPDGANAALVKAYPSVEKKSSLAIWKASAAVATSADTRSHCLGWQSPQVFSRLESFLRKNKLVTKSVPVKSAMTNAYLPCT